jgi:gliding motility-associated-like protein
MRKLLLCAGFFLSCAIALDAQTVIWSDNFDNGCTANCTAIGYNGGNGAWTQTVTGAEGADPNLWYVSCAENGHTNNVCGSGCQPASATSTLATLHVGSHPNSFGDIGAAYDAGGLCGFWTCPQTDRRIESPTINLTGQSTITLNFDYIEMGSGTTDDATVWYFDGTTWTLLVNTPATPVNCPGGQGRWTTFSIPLPASANNNANVRIGFRWVNNDDGVGTDPSFAVDNMTLTVPSSPAGPVAAFTPSATSVCVGQGVNFTDNSTGSPTSWLWSFPSASPSSAVTQNVSTVIWSAAGTYTVTLTATNASGSNTATTVITVNPNPTVTVTSSQQVICPGQTTNLTATGASTYAWQPGNLGGSPVPVSPVVQTTYTVTGTDALGCQDTAQYTIYMQSCPGPAPAFSSSDTSVCIGQAVNFTDLSTGGVTSWAWTFPSATPASATSQNVNNVVWNTAGTYTVTLTVSNANGSNSTTLVITVNPQPTVTATANPTVVCTGQQTTLTGSGAATYVWTPGPLSGSPVNVTPASNTTYSVIGTDANGCTGTAQVSVTVTPCPVPVVDFMASDTTICVGDCINYTDLSTNSPTSWSWTFSGAATATSNAQNPSNICYNSPGTFAVTLIAANANGSGSLTKTGYITVNPPPAAFAGADVIICTGQQTVLNGSGGVGYLWQPGNQPTASYTVTPAATTTYTLLVTDAIGCTASDQVIVTVQPCVAPAAAVSASASTICAGDCINFTDNSTGNPTGWAWSFPGGSPSTTTAQNPGSVCFNTPGTYTVRLIVTNAFGTDTTTMTVTAGAAPAADAGPAVSIAIGNQTTLTASGGTGTYSWSPTTGLGSPNSATTTASPTVTTTYTVTFTDANGCTDADTVTVIVIEAYGLFIPGAFSPNGDGANDMLFVYGAGVKTLDFVVYDRYGEVVFESHSVNDGWDGTLRGKALNGGIFAWYCNVEYYDGNKESRKGDVTLMR